LSVLLDAFYSRNEREQDFNFLLEE